MLDFTGGYGDDVASWVNKNETITFHFLSGYLSTIY